MIVLFIAFITFMALLLTPRQHYPWIIAAIVPVYAWLWWIIGRPLPMDDDWGEIGKAIATFLLLLALVPGFIRWVFSRWRPPEGGWPPRDWRPAEVTGLAVAIWTGAWLLTPELPVLIGAASCLAVGILLTLILIGGAIAFRRHRFWLGTAGLALLAGIVAVLIWPSAVVNAAEARAAGRPYCLVVARGANYRQARSLLDLTPLIMRGREGGKSASNFHGELLVLGERPLHWSYRNAGFPEEAYDNRPPSCEPSRGFGRHLPLF